MTEAEAVHEVITFFETNTNPLTVMLGVIVLAGLWYFFSPEVVRGRSMKQKRRREIHSLLTQGFTEYIIDQRIAGLLTAEEAEEEGYRKLKQAYPSCKDLFPSEETLKTKIERRLGKVDESLQTVSDRTPVAKEKKLLFTRK